MVYESPTIEMLGDEELAGVQGEGVAIKVVLVLLVAVKWAAGANVAVGANVVALANVTATVNVVTSGHRRRR